VITLAPHEGRLEGRVVDAQTGAPIVSFVVALRRVGWVYQLTTAPARAFIDPGGRYQLTQLEPGAARAVIAADGYAPAEVAITLTSGTARADARLLRGAALSGVVLDAKTRAPLAGAHVAVEGQRGETTAPVLRVDTATDGSGRFTLAGLGAGPLSYVVTAEGHHARVLSVPEVPREGSGPAQTVLLTPLGEDEAPKLEFTGIGISIMPAQEGVIVTNVFPGSGAAEAGLLKGDKLLRVDGRPVTEVGFEGAMTLIRGPEGSVVLLLVQRGTAPAAEVRVVRRAIRG
jgi:5-hydroxyisourate hydrolase-like protein (transthyretin family)